MTDKCKSIEQHRNGDKLSIGITEIMELLVVKRIPGVQLLKDGSDNHTGVATDVFVRRWQLPPQVIEEVVTEGPVISFVYHRRDGWANIDIPRRDIKRISHSQFGEIIRGVWNTKLEVKGAEEEPQIKIEPSGAEAVEKAVV